MKKTLLTLSLCATLLGMMSAPARAVVLMDEDINISFSFSNNFNGSGQLPANPDRFTRDSTVMASSGTHSLEEQHPEDLNTWGGQAVAFEESLQGTAGDASAADRNLTQFDHNGKVELSWWYKVIDPIDLNTDGNPLNDTNPANILPVTGISLRYNDSNNLDDMGVLAPANEDLTSNGTYDMIVDGEWHQASVVVNVLSAAARAALDEGGDNNSDVTSVWRFETDISKIQSQVPVPPNPADFAGAPTHFFIDRLEMNVAIPEPATLGLLGVGCVMMALGRRRHA